MLVSLSTQCSRTKRKGNSVLVLPVTVIEQAAAALRAAEHTHHPLVLIVDATKPLLYSLNVFVSTLLALGRETDEHITVGVICGASQVAVEQALAAGAQFVVPVHHESREHYVSILSWSSTRAAAQAAEVVVMLQSFDTAEALFDMLQSVRLAAVFTLEESLMVQNAFNPGYIRQMVRIAKLPIIAVVHDDKSPQQLQKALKTGVTGLLVEHEFDQAFTAGLRASLQNRTQFDPRIYLAKASLAVEEKMTRYLEVLCSM